MPKEPSPFSPEATNYFSRLDAAGDTTYVDYKQPLANYIDSLVTLGGAYWDTMESSTSFVGVGIQGVTVPLRDGMTVPTQNNFVAADLSQLTGLKGNGSTKDIATGITTDDAGTLNDVSISTYLTEQSATPSNRAFIGTQGLTIRETSIVNEVNTKSRNYNSQTTAATSILGFIGHSRSANNSYTLRLDGSSAALIQFTTVVPPTELTLFQDSTAGARTDARLATYHIGPAIDLATLEGLQATLLSEIRTAHTFVAAASYFSRLAAAGDTTHVAYKQPLTNYITSLVELGGAYWDDMLSAASFVGVGIQGVTVPLRDGMTVPTNNNFVADDLDQLTGLKDGTSLKFIDTGTIGTDYAQDDASLSVYASTTPTVIGTIAGDSTVSGGMQLRQGASTNIKHSCHGAVQTTVGAFGVGILGVSRDNSADYDYRTNATNGTLTQASVTVASGDITLFGASGQSSTYNGRLATYHAGPALNLATLEGLQATLLAEIAGIGFSTEAANYFSRLVNAGDSTFLAYRQPLANYIDSLVALGGAYWDDMNSAASFVGVGIQGVTVPLRDGMTVPTNNNFVAGDLNTLTGLKGDGSTKSIATNVAGTALLQDDASASVHITTAATGANKFYMTNAGGASLSLRSTPQQSLNSSSVATLGTVPTSGVYGASRSSSTTIDARSNQTSYSAAITSIAPSANDLYVYSIGAAPSADARLATYHAGPALNLATLEGLQDTLITEIAAI